MNPQIRNNPTKRALSLVFAASLLTISSPQLLADTDPKATSMLEAYANMALDVYSDSLNDAKKLQVSIDQFSANPTAAKLKQTKNAWLAARESYGQSEIFRLSNGPIDAEEGWIAEAYGSLEGQINAWPLDENMIDYTIDENGQRSSGNIIDASATFNPSGEDATSIDVSQISVAAITNLNENGGEANVASGYHAIEFLLWGQDQDYANFSADNISKGPLTAGQRPLSDFASAAGAERRLAYLQAATQKLVLDLTQVNNAWSHQVSQDCDTSATGCYRAALLGQLKGKDASKNINKKTALKQIIAGMGVFIKSELANERIAVAVLTPSEEDEHSCFSDNTHRDISLNYQGFVNVLKAQYKGKNYGQSLYSGASKTTQRSVDKLISTIDGKVTNMNQLAKSKWHFDYQILPDNNARDIRKMKNKMRKLGDQMVQVAKDLNISLTEDDVTDAEETKI